MLGASVGSFLNVVADRVPAGKSIVSPSSHCFNCDQKLKPGDLIPLISYIVLRGKCRYCGALIPLRLLLVELCTGLLYAVAFIKFGIAWELLPVLIYSSIFIVLMVIDAENGVLPGVIIYPGIIVALLISVVDSFIGVDPRIISSFAGLLIGSGLFLLIWMVIRIFKSRIITLKNAGLAGLIGACVGFPLVLAAACLSIIAGGLTAVILQVPALKRFNRSVLFDLCLALGAIATLFWSEEILNIAALLKSI